MRLVITFLAVLLASSALPCEALADYEAGERAFHRGDMPLARSLWRAPADKGDARAQHGLGRLLLLKADMRGMRLLRGSADAGYLPAEVHVAMLHLSGMYQSQDRSKCMALLTKAVAHKADVEAAHRIEAARARFILGLAYTQGAGVTRDRAKGAALLHKAADAGHAGAQLAYGKALERGEGVARDLVQAHTYFVLSWKEEVDGARVRALAVRKRLSKAEFATSRAAVRAWLEAKAAGTLGWVHGYPDRLSRGEKAVETLEGMHLDVLEVVMTFAAISDLSCKKRWLRSRTVTKPRSGRSMRWVERWTVDVCGRSKSFNVTFQGVGKDIRWTVGSGRLGAS